MTMNHSPQYPQGPYGTTNPAPGASPPPSQSKTLLQRLLPGLATALDHLGHYAYIVDTENHPVYRSPSLEKALQRHYEADEENVLAGMLTGHCGTLLRDAVDARQPHSHLVSEAGITFHIQISPICYPDQPGLVGTLICMVRLPAEYKYGAAESLTYHDGTSQTGGAIVGKPATSRVNEGAFLKWLERSEDAYRKVQRLSPREREVVELVSSGMPNKSIARELEISVKTIEKHRSSATRKLGVASTPEMVRLYTLADVPDTFSQVGR